jgi:hypothetical protein
LLENVYAGYTNPFLYEGLAYDKSKGDHGSHQDMIFRLWVMVASSKLETAHQKWLRLVSPLAKFNENWDFKNTLGLTLAQQLAQLEDPTPIGDVH